ncbi:hypothetical protein E2C01_006980 [Portunus trituberculatus]|uniref:Uncharacterized protein n=1 Tax=Portunus trituberculatus TaxID=210409 RepID=A0A5B7CXQ6_PORTR|nr:hypothetical protein [Portunus trituberculatus]
MDYRSTSDPFDANPPEAEHGGVVVDVQEEQQKQLNKKTHLDASPIEGLLRQHSPRATKR